MLIYTNLIQVYSVLTSAVSSVEPFSMLHIVWTFSTACIVDFNSSLLIVLLTGPFLLDVSETLAANARRYIYFGLCSGFSLTPGLNSESTSNSKNEKCSYRVLQSEYTFLINLT